jgi:hypothetical protein
VLWIPDFANTSSKPRETPHVPLCDHTHDTGSMDRKTFGNKGNKFFKGIIDRDYPPTVQLLCHACNQAKRLNGGVCPHNE